LDGVANEKNEERIPEKTEPGSRRVQFGGSKKTGNREKRGESLKKMNGVLSSLKDLGWIAKGGFVSRKVRGNKRQGQSLKRGWDRERDA